MRNNKGSALISVLTVSVVLSLIMTTLFAVSASAYKKAQADTEKPQAYYTALAGIDAVTAIINDVSAPSHSDLLASVDNDNDITIDFGVMGTCDITLTRNTDGDVKVAVKAITPTTMRWDDSIEAVVDQNDAPVIKKEFLENYWNSVYALEATLKPGAFDLDAFIVAFSDALKPIPDPLSPNAFEDKNTERVADDPPAETMLNRALLDHIPAPDDPAYTWGFDGVEDVSGMPPPDFTPIGDLDNIFTGDVCWFFYQSAVISAKDFAFTVWELGAIMEETPYSGIDPFTLFADPTSPPETQFIFITGGETVEFRGLSWTNPELADLYIYLEAGAAITGLDGLEATFDPTYTGTRIIHITNGGLDIDDDYDKDTFGETLIDAFRGDSAIMDLYYGTLEDFSAGDYKGAHIDGQ